MAMEVADMIPQITLLLEVAIRRARETVRTTGFRSGVALQWVLSAMEVQQYVRSASLGIE